VLYAGYKDIPSRLYEGNGELLTTYRNRSIIAGLGFGLVLKKSYNLEVSYEQEAMNVDPRTTRVQPELLTGTKSVLRKINLVAAMDTLDNLRLPQEGILFKAFYEGSLELLNTDLPFRKMEFSLDAYKSFSEADTIRFYGYWGEATTGTPFYKFLKQGHPQTFIGMRYDELQGHGMKILRGEYRHKYADFLYLKFIGNVAFDFDQRRPEVTYSPKSLWGLGAAVMVSSPAGPIELIFSVGSKNLLQPATLGGSVYLVFGTRF
jgi:NTE family protein